MKIGLRISIFRQTERSGFRQKAASFTFEKCGGLPTAATLAVLLAFTSNLRAADVESDFAAANKLYAEGKFSDAAKTYESILQSGGQSPALLFNYANAEFKAGNLGRAIAAYRQAGLLTPRDAEIRANLQFVRNQVQGSSVGERRWQEWLGQLTLNEWTLLAAGAFWLTLILLALRQIRPALGAKLKGVTALVAGLTVLSGAALAWQVANHFSRQTAVVVLPEVTARSGPFDEGQSAFTVHDGAELAVMGRHGDWLQVNDGEGKIGWLKTTQINVLPGA